MKILLFEPDTFISKSITKQLMSKRYTVDRFETIQHALSSIDNGYSFFIIEMSHTPTQSLHMLKSIKDYYPSTPVMMLYFGEVFDVTALKKAYMYGCDDVVKTPFLIDEIETKMTKLLNIRHDTVTFAPKCSFDFNTGLLCIGSFKRYFSKKEKRLFTILFSNKEHVVSFETIKTMVWEGESASLESIRSLIRRLRQKIPFHCIETIVDTGYILKLNTLKQNNITLQKKHSFQHCISA